jgi:NADH:ubiquinone oxidoreductase subunit 2 (subunit N)
MEGPTPSSAIFYGALSIHAGVFLLLRTLPIWIGCPEARLWIGMVGLATAFLASGISHVQSNVKGQIGYASVAQVGLMFVELALGWDELVLYHFVGNASLRCYQLLVSPSVVAYLLKLQSTRSGPTGAVFPGLSLERLLPGKLRSSLFVLTSQEAYMEMALNRSMFWLPQWTARNIFLENRSIAQVWNRSVLLMVGLATLASRGDFHEAWPFLAGVLVFYLLGVLGIRQLPADVRAIKLDRYYGYGALYPGSARMLFVSFLGMSGFPISPAFYGQDVLLASAMHLSPVLAAVLALGVIFNGMVLARCFSRLFLGVERVRWKAALAEG